MLNLGQEHNGQGLPDSATEVGGLENLEIEIREMRPEDLDGVLWVEQSSFRTPWTRTMFEDEFKNPDMAHYLIARCKEHVVGYMGFWKITKEAHITNLAVHPAFRRHKIGERLLFAAMRLARRLGMERATLEVRASNEAAQKLYEKYGFQLVALRKKYYNDNNEDAWIMWMNNIKAFENIRPE
ncbi:MAG: ribosomal protein S18-alanine N-acetyltransferase [Candidatus Firestonebacteria bacterium]|nr:ribosomal protein S18-alanine N-acetyltransferase [Candidatus Firestonebacteria bacterium]